MLLINISENQKIIKIIKVKKGHKERDKDRHSQKSLDTSSKKHVSNILFYKYGTEDFNKNCIFLKVISQRDIGLGQRMAQEFARTISV